MGNESQMFLSERAGALCTPIHTERQVNVYPLFEPELESIGTSNRFASLFCSIGALFTGLSLSCIWDISQAACTTRLAWGVFGVFLVTATAAFVLAAFISYRRTKYMDKIKRESVARAN